MNLRRLKKDQIIWLSENKCKHGHTYLEHPNCLIKERPDRADWVQEKIGFLDIEATNLDADFGIMLSYAIVDLDSDEVFSGTITEDDILDSKNNREYDKVDKRLISLLLRDLENFDRIVGHYSKRFDIPFVRTRALYCGLDFPSYGTKWHDDTWVWAKNKLKLHSNRLDSVALAILGNTNKTRIEYKYWLGALHGDKECLSYILDHNIKDVLDLKRVYIKLVPYARYQKSSI